jgi:tetratricopeptide (TPR) repeat protein
MGSSFDQAEVLDLAKHEIDEIPGKLLHLNGASYVFLDQVAEGGEKFCYPIQNIQSGLILFIAKLHKFKPGSAAYDDLKRKQPFMFSYWLGIPSTKKEILEYGLNSKESIALHTETYEISGGLFDIQEFGSPPDTAEFHERHFENAIALLKHDQISDAASAFEEVLGLNPSHTLALSNLAICLTRLGNPVKAIPLALRSIEIEPNSIPAYLNAAQIFRQLEKGKSAVAILQQSLDRWPWHFKTFHFRMTLAQEYGLIDLYEKGIEFCRAQNQNELVQFYEDSLSALYSERENISELSNVASGLQGKGQWSQAGDLWHKITLRAKGNFLAKLNLCICKYHQGQYPEVISLAPFLYYGGSGFQEIVTPLLLFALASYRSLDYKSAKQALFAIDSMVENKFDLPGIPNACIDLDGQLGMMETKDVALILECLDELIRRESDPESRERLGLLLQQYQEYGAALQAGS